MSLPNFLIFCLHHNHISTKIYPFVKQPKLCPNKPLLIVYEIKLALAWSDRSRSIRLSLRFRSHVSTSFTVTRAALPKKFRLTAIDCGVSRGRTGSSSIPVKNSLQSKKCLELLLIFPFRTCKSQQKSLNLIIWRRRDVYIAAKMANSKHCSMAAVTTLKYKFYKPGWMWKVFRQIGVINLCQFGYELKKKVFEGSIKSRWF